MEVRGWGERDGCKEVGKDKGEGVGVKSLK